MTLTMKQQAVLGELRTIGRDNAYRWRDKNDHLHAEDVAALARGDGGSAFGMGGLTYQVGNRLGMTAGSVLSIFKALERKGLIIRETRAPEYRRPLYWWPVGLAAELHAELSAASRQLATGERQQ